MPPFGILDRSNVAKASVGSKPLREVVDVIKPKVHIFGHIHENYGYMEMNQTHFYNVSHFDYWNNPKHEPTVI
jgi:Icc-related predicted phosphoesterase